MDGRCSQHGAPRAGDVSPSDSARLRRGQRLNHKSDFDRVLGSRVHRVSSGPFLAFACPSAADGPRLGLIVGRRVARRAVDRNRVKRVVRESFRRAQARLPLLDIVVQLARPTAGHDPAAALEEIWMRLRQAAGSTP
jgi:ribonuclease P protein component